MAVRLARSAPEAHGSRFPRVLARRPEPATRQPRLARSPDGAQLPGAGAPGEFGLSFPDALTGVHATVFYDRIERVSKTQGDIALATMLGNAMAHELGDVLLGNTDTLPAGIHRSALGRGGVSSEQVWA